MHPVFLSLILVLFFFAFFLMGKLFMDLDGPLVSRRKRNSRFYRCLDSQNRKWSLVDLIPGRRNYQRMLERLPGTLEELDVSNTDIEFLPRLPAGLKRLRADNCPRLRRVEALPDGIEHVTSWTCPELSQLPPLSEGLKELWVVSTAVESLPRLPRSLEVLDARCNDRLVSISEDWPSFGGGQSEGGSLHWINLCNSPGARTVAGNLPEHVIAEVRETGVSGWRFNALFHCVQYANQPFEPEPFVFC